MCGSFDEIRIFFCTATACKGSEFFDDTVNSVGVVNFLNILSGNNLFKRFLDFGDIGIGNLRGINNYCNDSNVFFYGFLNGNYSIISADNKNLNLGACLGFNIALENLKSYNLAEEVIGSALNFGNIYQLSFAVVIYFSFCVVNGNGVACLGVNVYFACLGVANCYAVRTTCNVNVVLCIYSRVSSQVDNVRGVCSISFGITISVDDPKLCACTLAVYVGSIFNFAIIEIAEYLSNRIPKNLVADYLSFDFFYIKAEFSSCLHCLCHGDAFIKLSCNCSIEISDKLNVLRLVCLFDEA